MDNKGSGLSALDWQKLNSSEWTATNGTESFRASHRSGPYFEVYATTKILGEETEICVGRWDAQILGIRQ